MPDASGAPRRPSTDFLVTKEHRRFVEFAEACKREGYIGLCHGVPGVGKTMSARRFCSWDETSQWIERPTWPTPDELAEPPADLGVTNAVFWTPSVTVSPRNLDQQIMNLCHRYDLAADEKLQPEPAEKTWFTPRRWYVELVVVDEADRLRTNALEMLRDIFDRHGVALILIGMPGIEKKLARYPQLYSRIGFAHRYNALTADELRFVLEHHWERLGLSLSADDFTDAEAVAAVARITGGNFRLVHRLFAQIRRILDINQLTTVTAEVVEAARETLVIGTN
jgi:DNA transposition AAA+ family ATPase